MDVRAIRWNCARCEVSVGRIDGEPSRLPDTWTQSEGISYCLSCSRARAGDAAVDSAPESSSSDDRARRRRNALIAFEIARTPAAPNRTIANACRTSLLAVAAFRRAAPDRSPATDRVTRGQG